MTSSPKKAIVRRLSGDFVPGYLATKSFVRSAPQQASQTFSSGGHAHSIDLLDLEGRTLLITLSDIKFICFVRDFNREDQQNPERLTRRAFLSRPRADGLWLRLTFPTGDQLEGLVPHDHTLLDSLLEDFGLFLTPPDERANTHRIYVPRTAIAALELLAVINAPIRKSTPRPALLAQPTLFPTD